MDIEILGKGELYDDNESLKMIIHSPDMHNAITIARQEICARLKYNDTIGTEEEQFLKRLEETLHVEGIDH